MHLAASFTMVTNHLHGPDRGRVETRGVGACGRGGDGKAGARTLWAAQGGAATGAGVGAAAHGNSRGDPLKASVGRLEGASEVARLSFPARPPPDGDHQEE